MYRVLTVLVDSAVADIATEAHSAKTYPHEGKEVAQPIDEPPSCRIDYGLRCLGRYRQSLYRWSCNEEARPTLTTEVRPCAKCRYLESILQHRYCTGSSIKPYTKYH